MTNTKKETILDKLISIQTDLKAPKWQYNNFWKYKYRSCEDILESLKPLLKKYKCSIIIDDELVFIWDRYYIKATAILKDDTWEEKTHWYAREEENKKWMDWSQVTGASSSYARKYALNWLLAIDDNKDSDTTNIYWGVNEKKKPEFKEENFEKLKAIKDQFQNWVEAINKAKENYQLDAKYQTKILSLYK